MPLEIGETEKQGVTVLTLTGRVTLGVESKTLRTRLKDMLDEGGKTKIVLDLGGVAYMDSAGLGALVASFTSAQSYGAEIKLANLTKKLGEQLQITKLATVFEVFGSVEDAVRSFSSNPK